MSGDGEGPTSPAQSLGRATASWVERGEPVLLERWLDRELDAEGIPRRLPVPRWVDCLSGLADARRRREAGWPDAFDARIEGFFRQTLRFCRPGGASAFGPIDAPAEVRSLFRYWADTLSDPGLGTVVDWWFPGRPRRHLPPPLPATSQAGRPLAVLRSQWTKEGDFLAIDHRTGGASTAVELFGLGRRWLGPSWESGPGTEPVSGARPTCWVSQSAADLAEWAFRVGGARVLRTALLLRGRRLALLADQVDGGDSLATMRVAVPEDLEAAPLTGSRGLTLSAPGGRPSARVLPLGLPCVDYPSDRGAFAREGDALVLRQKAEGKRRWLPLLVSWDPLRNRKSLLWRPLTVTEQTQICPPDRAFAVRASWGRDETLLIYRSLARPAPRVVLGHQTRARFLVAIFNAKGNVEPLLTVED